MRTRVLLVVLLAAGALAAGATTAPADTLFTNSDYTARVAVGSTTTLTATGVTLKSGATTVDTCTSASVTTTLTQNDESALSGALSNGSFNGCTLPIVGDYPWSFGVNTGTSTRDSRNTRTVFSTASWTDVALTYVDLWTDAGGGITFANTGYSGTLSSGTSMSQSAADGGVCLDLNNAGLLSGPSGTLTVAGAFCATQWSTGTTARATLYTNGLHSTTVAVGTAASLTAGTITMFIDGGTTFWNACSGSTLNVTVSRNSGGIVVVTVDTATFGSCAQSQIAVSLPWTLKVGGTAAVTGSNRVFTDTRLTGVGTTTGLLGHRGTLPPAIETPFTDGVYSTQPVSPGAPVCLVMDHAGPLVTAGTPAPTYDLELTGQYCFEGATASTWSLG